MLKVILKSDFLDYYDHWFDRLTNKEPHITFSRFSKDRTPRSKWFQHMENDLGLLTAPHGLVTDVADTVAVSPEDTQMIVYLDEFSHRGDGKVKVSVNTAREKYPDKFCSLYMQPDEPSLSYRILVIGSRQYLLRYQSNHPWKSNVGDVDIKLSSRPFKPLEFSHFPMFSVDFVVSGDVPFAVDFNSAPGLRWTPLEELVDGREIVKEVSDVLRRAIA